MTVARGVLLDHLLLSYALSYNPFCLLLPARFHVVIRCSSLFMLVNTALSSGSDTGVCCIFGYVKSLFLHCYNQQYFLRKPHTLDWELLTTHSYLCVDVVQLCKSNLFRRDESTFELYTKL